VRPPAKFARAEKLFQTIRAGKKVDLHAGERSLLSAVPLRLRLLMLLFFPILGLLYFSANSVWEKSQTLNELRAMQEITDMAVKSSAVIHEAQKERGMSAGFLASGGAKFGAELPQQRKETDKRIVEIARIESGRWIKAVCSPGSSRCWRRRRKS